MSEFVPTEDQILRVAKAINGPLLPVPTTSRYTLDELRDVRWSNITKAEQDHLKSQARSALVESVKVLKNAPNPANA